MWYDESKIIKVVLSKRIQCTRCIEQDHNELLYLEPSVDKSFPYENNWRVYLNPEMNDGLMVTSVIV